MGTRLGRRRRTRLLAVEPGAARRRPDAGAAGAGRREARFRFFEAVTESLRPEAARQPLLLVLDDLQAADEGSILLLEFVATELPEMSALVVALGRPETARLDELDRHATRTLEP